MNSTFLPDLLAVLLVIGGVLGIVVPVLPGTPLIFAGALVHNLAHGWEPYGWGWLLLLLALTVVAEVGDWWLGTLGARKGGASGRALVVGMVLGLVGLFLLPPFGFIIGSIGGVVGTEWLRARDTKQAIRAGSGWLIGWLVSLLMQGAVAMVMVGIIFWRAL